MDTSGSKFATVFIYSRDRVRWNNALPVYVSGNAPHVHHSTLSKVFQGGLAKTHSSRRIHGYGTSGRHMHLLHHCVGCHHSIMC